MTYRDTPSRHPDTPALRTPFRWADAPFGPVLQSTALAAFHHLFTTRMLTLRGTGADRDWAMLEGAMLIAPRRLFAPKQVHEAGVLVVGRNDVASRGLNDPDRPHADIVMTNDPDSAVAVQAADCVPLLLADSRSGAVAAAHAGWRGTVRNVARHAVEAMTSHYGTRPGDLLVAIGPSIGPCCYQVGSDVRDGFEAGGYDPEVIARWFAAESAEGRFRLDVARANRDQLVAAGVDASHIAMSGLCTACHPTLFFSYRRDGAGTGRLAAAIRPAPLDSALLSR